MSEISSSDKISGPTPKPRITKTGWIILGSCGLIAGSIYALTTPFILPALRRYCLPFVPATTNQVRNVFKVLERRSGSLVDLGSGDGRIVIEAAQKGFTATGIELNYWLVLYSRLFAWKQNVKSTQFLKKDLWTAKLHCYDNVVIFGVDCMMQPLEVKLSQELNKDAVIVACRFPLPNRRAVKTIDAGIDSVWLYDRESLMSNKQ